MASDPEGRLLLKVIFGTIFVVIGGVELLRSLGWVHPAPMAPQPPAVGVSLDKPTSSEAPQPPVVGVSLDKPTSSSQSMPFEQCLEVIRRTASELGVAPVNIVETDILRIVRFCAVDESILVSCSRPDEKLVLTRSPYRCD
jgi:hypothetical protein